MTLTLNAKMNCAAGTMLAVSLAFSTAAATAGDSTNEPAPACTTIESFLVHGKPSGMHDVSTGVTGTHRLTLESGDVHHDAHVQTIDEQKNRFEGSRGEVELNFRDSYKFNIAGYELAKLLGLNMVPPYVERRVTASNGSLSWWINNAMMEADRYKKKIAVPDPESWNQQMYAVRVFHELIYDTDPNMTNLLITKDWQIWMIDFTRAFRTQNHIRETKNLAKCDRRLLEHLRRLDEKTLREKLGPWLTKTEIHALDMRRAKIVQFFDNQVKQKGESAVLYDFPRTSQPCGAGLM